MPSKSQPIEERLEEALKDPAVKSELEKVLPDVLSNLRDRDSQISKRLLILGVAIALIELVRAAQVNEVAIMGAKIQNFSIFIKFSPAIISFLLFQVMSAVASRRVLTEVYNSGFKALYPKLYLVDMEEYTTPQEIIKFYKIVERHSHGAWKRIMSGSSDITVFTFTIMPTIYVIWKICEAVSSNFMSVSAWISAGIGGFFLFQTYVLIFATNRAVDADADSTQGRNAT